jgi:hypothetical protein
MAAKRPLALVAAILTWSITMAQTVSYLSDPATVDRVHALIQAGQTDSAAALIRGLGDDKTVAQAFINIQCDLNNMKGDPDGSAKIGWAGADFCRGKSFKVAEAMLLHNIGAIFAPDFRVQPGPGEVRQMLEAARRQLALRREVGDAGPLMWALWDLGLAELTGGNGAAAMEALAEGAAMAREQEDRDAEAWCNILAGKAKCLHSPGLKDEGERELRAAQDVIAEVGEDWEKEGAGQILESVGLKP